MHMGQGHFPRCLYVVHVDTVFVHAVLLNIARSIMHTNLHSESEGLVSHL